MDVNHGYLGVSKHQYAHAYASQDSSILDPFIASCLCKFLAKRSYLMPKYRVLIWVKSEDPVVESMRVISGFKYTWRSPTIATPPTLPGDNEVTTSSSPRSYLYPHNVPHIHSTDASLPLSATKPYSNVCPSCDPKSRTACFAF